MRTKKTGTLLLTGLCLALSCCGQKQQETDAVPKVILDCDMTYLGDDAMCLCILAQADSQGLIDLLGVTVTGGNSFVAVGTNAALRQLELIGREDIPVLMGTDEPIAGFRNLDEQEKIVGEIGHWGAMRNLDKRVTSEQYHDLGAFYDRKWGYSQSEPLEISSVDFLLEQVRQHPKEVTIVSTGAPTNIALACEKDGNFAASTAGIVYVGAVLDGKGSYTPCADFNCFYDAEAFDICFQSGFPMQTIVPKDVEKDAMLDKAVFDRMDAKEETPVSKLWLEERYGLYRRTPTRKDPCLDAVAAVSFLKPDVVRETKNLYVRINTDAQSAGYGSVSVSEKQEADHASYVTFITSLHTDSYWEFVTDLLCRAGKAD